MLNIDEAQELHELIGAAIEAEDYSGLKRARELASIVVTDAEQIHEAEQAWQREVWRMTRGQ